MRVLNPSSDQISLTDVVVTALCTGLLNSTCFICWSLTDHFNTFPWQAQPIKYCKLCSVQGISNVRSFEIIAVHDKVIIIKSRTDIIGFYIC